MRTDEAEMKGVVLNAAELDWAETYDVGHVGDHLEADNLVCQCFADIDVPVLPFDLAGAADSAKLDVGGVLQLRQERRQPAEGRLVDGRRRLLVQGLVRPLLVVLLPEAIEGQLLGAKGAAWRQRRLLLERPVHALVTTVL